MPTKITSRHIEIAVANWFGYRTNLIVPNVSWGFGLRHECDMLICSNSNYLTEVEIKISKSDLKADLLKSHKHDSKIIKKLYFAYPESMSDCDSLVPERAGIIHIWEWKSNPNFNTGTFGCKLIRNPVAVKGVGKIDENKKIELMRLGCMRIWSLKEHLNNYQNK